MHGNTPNATAEQPNRLRELWIAGGFTRVGVAARVGVDPTTVWRWATGRSAIPDEHKVALARLFGVSVEHLMRWDDTTDEAASA